MAGGGFLVLALLVLMLALVGNIIGLATPRWYVVTLPAGENQLSLWRSCTAGVCAGIDFDAISAGITQCSRSSAEIQTRFNACRAMTIISLVLFFCAFLVIIGAWLADGSCPWATALFCILLSLLLLAATIAVWIVTTESWLYCNKTFCSYTAGTYPTCANGFGYSFILLCIAFPLAIMAFTFAAATFHQVSRAAEEEDGTQWRRASPSQRSLTYSESAQRPRSVTPTRRSISPTTEPYDLGNGRRSPSLGQSYEAKRAPARVSPRATPRQSPRQSPRSESPRSRSPRAAEKQLPEGDWAYDGESGLYWSDKEQLYLDRDSEQYYDPFSGQWYDPATDSWYTHDG